MCNSNKIQCPKCGGSGKVEHSHVCEGVCFMCAGFGEVFPKRVTELSEKSKKRKNTIEVKRLAIQEDQKSKEDKYWEDVYKEIEKRNYIFIKNYKCATHEGAVKFYDLLKNISSLLGFDKETSEVEFREMINDFFKTEGFTYRFEIHKYCLKYHNFSYLNLKGKYNDFTECMHEVQNIIKY